MTLVAIPGLFLTAGLPAYAFSPAQLEGDNLASAAHSEASTGAQAVTVPSAATQLTVARDGFTATSPEELAQRAATAQQAAAQQAAAQQQSARAGSTSAFASYGPRAEGDDYPWPNKGTYSEGGGLSALGYYYRECVDFVAWRLNRDAGSTGDNWRWTWSSLTPSGGNASAWATAWANNGWATGSAPVVGAVAWFNYNHVAYVQSVGGDGTVALEEYNWSGSHAYHTRTVKASEVPLFLYPPT